ncbi:MAG: VOC family protein [Bacteroidetes bacterium]|nr:VOC family protein [Bacteroidota bacterium]
MKILSLLLFTLSTCLSCSQQKRSNSLFDNLKNNNFTVHNDFETYFKNCGVEGSIVIFDKNNQHWILSDTLNVKTESLPASTFKIINLLIALETKTIKDENEIVKWVGKTDTVKYGYRPEIYHDMSVKQAFEVSAGWVFIELAKKIGKDNYKKYLSACNYGNLNLTQNNDDFWNFGNFGISPINQVEFIKNLYEEKLPFSERNIEIVKKVMLSEQTNNYTIRAKTGWTRENNTNTGWWVGYLETQNNTYFFATRLLQNRKNNRDDFGSCRKEITKKIFYDLGFLQGNESSIKNNSLFNSIDHIPIVVNDLVKIKDIFKNQLHFTIKEGKVHEGIKNCFVKFQDGTYLEFIEPLDNSQTIGKYYANFLKTRQGGTSLAISVSNAELIKKMLKEKTMQFTADSTKIWQTIEPENADLFFIEYVNKNWKENATITTHSNTAKSLTAIYFLTNKIEVEIKKYKALGFTEIESGNYLETPYRLFKVGQSNLYLLDGKKSSKINQLLHSKKLQGICGFEIKVNSLPVFNSQIKQNKNVVFEKNSTTTYFSDYNIFITFTE